MSVALLNVPVGTIIDFAGMSTPEGYLECDGRAVGRSAFSALFDAIGTLWGAGDGSNTFNVPDLRGRCAIGAGTGTAGGATAHALASKGGDVRMHAHSHGTSVTQPVFKLPDHKHGNTSGAYMVYNANLTSNNTTFAAGNYKRGAVSDTGNPTSKPECTRSTNVGVTVNNSGGVLSEHAALRHGQEAHPRRVARRAVA